MQRLVPPGRRWFSHASVSIAIALLVVLLGGLALGLLLVHQTSTRTPGGLKSQATAISTACTPSLPVPSPVPGPGYGFSFQMVDELTGWALAKPWRVLRTTDGAVNWQNVTPATGVGGDTTFFLNALVAWVAVKDKATVIFKTTDGGQSWQRMPLKQLCEVDQLTFLNLQDGWMLNTQGAAENEVADLLRTTDGGASWGKVSTTGMPPHTTGTIPISGTKTGVSFLTASTGWMTGFAPVSNFFWLYVTHDGGVTWQPQMLPMPPGVTEAQFELIPPTFFNDHDGMLPVQVVSPTAGATALDVYVTHDGGATWQSTSLVQASDRLVDFVDPGHGWAAEGTTLFATSDGGQHWATLPASSLFHDLVSLNFVSSTLGWAFSVPICSCLVKLKTTDGGQTWTVIL